MKNQHYLVEVSKKIAEILGLHFHSSQFQDLERRLKSVAKDLSIEPGIISINQWLSKSSFTAPELKTLAAHLTVGETYFFREKIGLELFRQDIIPELIKQRQGKDEQIRIWCAGCSSGEEPYTLAMIFKEHFPQLANWNITILATDISPVAIQKALVGEYTDWSFRETDVAMKSKFFFKSGKNWSIMSEIKKMVTFSYLNLSKNSYPSSLTNTVDMDVVFCRNVMMYFTPKVIKEVSHKFYNSLIQKGWLITSQVELNDEYFSAFERVQFNRGIFYRKSEESKDLIKPVLSKSIAFLPSGITQQVVKNMEPTKSIKSIPKIIHPVANTKEKIPSDRTELTNLFQKGQYLKCIENCLQMIEIVKVDNEIFALLVKSYANSGLLRVGEEIINNIISKNPATAEMYYIYASFLKEQNQLDEAEMMLKKAIYLNHNHIMSYLMLGELFIKSNKRYLAIKHCETVIGLLTNYDENDIVPESDGLRAGGIKALAINMVNKL
jgi:chemotaxis protein methyltransferase CheR